MHNLCENEIMYCVPIIMATAVYTFGKAKKDYSCIIYTVKKWVALYNFTYVTYYLLFLSQSKTTAIIIKPCKQL